MDNRAANTDMNSQNVVVCVRVRPLNERLLSGSVLCVLTTWQGAQASVTIHHRDGR
jgi:hypothetical protein